MVFAENITVNIGSKIKKYVYSAVLILLVLISAGFAFEFYRESIRVTKELIDRVSQEWAARVKIIFNEELSGVNSLRNIFILRGINRATAIDLLTMHTTQKELVLGTFVVYEANAFDGRDADYRYYPAHDQTGRLALYLARNLDQKIRPELAVGYETGEWYTLPKETLSGHLMEPYSDTIQGNVQLITSITLPILIQNKFVGVIGIDMGLNFLQERFGKVKPYKENGYINLISDKGIYIVNGIDKSLKNKSINDTEEGKRIFEKVVSQKGYILEDNSYYHVFLPISLEGIPESWYIEVTFPLSELLIESVTRIKYIILASAILTFLGIIIFNKLLNSLIYDPLKVAIDISRTIADGDLRIHSKIKYDGEMGTLITAIEKIGLNNSNLISQVQKLNMQLMNTVNVLQRSAEEFGSVSTKQSNSITETSKSTNELSVSSSKIDFSIQNVDENLSGINRSIHELSASVGMINTRMQSLDKLSKESTKKAKHGGETVNHASIVMNEIRKTTIEVSKFTKVIADISKKTNLLALNAAIEAARAGESGRGFAVVADEIAKLADNTVNTVKSITSLMEQTNKAVNQGMIQVEESIGIFASISEKVEEVSNNSEEVSLQVDASMISVNQIMGSLKELALLTSSILSSSSGQKKFSNEIKLAIAEIELVTNSNSGEVQKLLEVATELNLQTDRMRELIHQFKI